MPEGDTLHRAARALHARLAGHTVVRFTSRMPALADTRLEGRAVTLVEARGKNLLVRFDDGRVLHTHMMMSGSWHLYRPGERWRKPEGHARAVIETDDTVAVCFSAPVIELLTADQEKRKPQLATLGPDILAPDFDVAGASARLRMRDDAPLGVAVMTQSLVAGIGNIYKSESLFVARVDPFAKVTSFDDATLERVIAEARRLMRKNLDPSRNMRTTRSSDGARHWVYDRSGEPCFVCGGRIAMLHQGEQRRSTYYCAACQGVVSAA